MYRQQTDAKATGDPTHFCTATQLRGSHTHEQQAHPTTSWLVKVNDNAHSIYPTTQQWRLCIHLIIPHCDFSPFTVNATQPRSTATPSHNKSQRAHVYALLQPQSHSGTPLYAQNGHDGQALVTLSRFSCITLSTIDPNLKNKSEACFAHITCPGKSNRTKTQFQLHPRAKLFTSISPLNQLQTNANPTNMSDNHTGHKQAHMTSTKAKTAATPMNLIIQQMQQSKEQGFLIIPPERYHRLPTFLLLTKQYAAHGPLRARKESGVDDFDYSDLTNPQQPYAVAEMDHNIALIHAKQIASIILGKVTNEIRTFTFALLEWSSSKTDKNTAELCKHLGAKTLVRLELTDFAHRAPFYLLDEAANIYIKNQSRKMPQQRQMITIDAHNIVQIAHFRKQTDNYPTIINIIRNYNIMQNRLNNPTNEIQASSVEEPLFYDIMLNHLNLVGYIKWNYIFCSIPIHAQQTIETAGQEFALWQKNANDPNIPLNPNSQKIIEKCLTALNRAQNESKLAHKLAKIVYSIAPWLWPEAFIAGSAVATFSRWWQTAAKLEKPAFVICTATNYLKLQHMNTEDQRMEAITTGVQFWEIEPGRDNNTDYVTLTQCMVPAEAKKEPLKHMRVIWRHPPDQDQAYAIDVVLVQLVRGSFREERSGNIRLLCRDNDELEHPLNPLQPNTVLIFDGAHTAVAHIDDESKRLLGTIKSKTKIIKVQSQDVYALTNCNDMHILSVTNINKVTPIDETEQICTLFDAYLKLHCINSGKGQDRFIHFNQFDFINYVKRNFYEADFHYADDEKKTRKALKDMAQICYQRATVLNIEQGLVKAFCAAQRDAMKYHRSSTIRELAQQLHFFGIDAKPDESKHESLVLDIEDTDEESEQSNKTPDPTEQDSDVEVVEEPNKGKRTQQYFGPTIASDDDEMEETTSITTKTASTKLAEGQGQPRESGGSVNTRLSTAAQIEQYQQAKLRRELMKTREALKRDFHMRKTNLDDYNQSQLNQLMQKAGAFMAHLQTFMNLSYDKQRTCYEELLSVYTNHKLKREMLDPNITDKQISHVDLFEAIQRNVVGEWIDGLAPIITDDDVRALQSAFYTVNNVKDCRDCFISYYRTYAALGRALTGKDNRTPLDHELLTLSITQGLQWTRLSFGLDMQYLQEWHKVLSEHKAVIRRIWKLPPNDDTLLHRVRKISRSTFFPWTLRGNPATGDPDEDSEGKQKMPALRLRHDSLPTNSAAMLRRVQQKLSEEQFEQEQQRQKQSDIDKDLAAWEKAPARKSSVTDVFSPYYDTGSRSPAHSPMLTTTPFDNPPSTASTFTTIPTLHIPSLQTAEETKEPESSDTMSKPSIKRDFEPTLTKADYIGKCSTTLKMADDVIATLFMMPVEALKDIYEHGLARRAAWLDIVRNKAGLDKMFEAIKLSYEDLQQTANLYSTDTTPIASLSLPPPRSGLTPHLQSATLSTIPPISSTITASTMPTGTHTLHNAPVGAATPATPSTTALATASASTITARPTATAKVERSPIAINLAKKRPKKISEFLLQTAELLQRVNLILYEQSTESDEDAPFYAPQTERTKPEALPNLAKALGTTMAQLPNVRPKKIMTLYEQWGFAGANRWAPMAYPWSRLKTVKSIDPISAPSVGVPSGFLFRIPSVPQMEIYQHCYESSGIIRNVPPKVTAHPNGHQIITYIIIPRNAITTFLARAKRSAEHKDNEHEPDAAFTALSNKIKENLPMMGKLEVPVDMDKLPRKASADHYYLAFAISNAVYRNIPKVIIQGQQLRYIRTNVDYGLKNTIHAINWATGLNFNLMLIKLHYGPGYAQKKSRRKPGNTDYDDFYHWGYNFDHLCAEGSQIGIMSMGYQKLTFHATAKRVPPQNTPLDTTITVCAHDLLLLDRTDVYQKIYEEHCRNVNNTPHEMVYFINCVSTELQRREVERRLNKRKQNNPPTGQPTKRQRTTTKTTGTPSKHHRLCHPSHSPTTPSLNYKYEPYTHHTDDRLDLIWINQLDLIWILTTFDIHYQCPLCFPPFSGCADSNHVVRVSGGLPFLSIALHCLVYPCLRMIDSLCLHLLRYLAFSECADRNHVVYYDCLGLSVKNFSSTSPYLFDRFASYDSFSFSLPLSECANRNYVARVNGRSLFLLFALHCFYYLCLLMLDSLCLHLLHYVAFSECADRNHVVRVSGGLFLLLFKLHCLIYAHLLQNLASTQKDKRLLQYHLTLKILHTQYILKYTPTPRINILASLCHHTLSLLVRNLESFQLPSANSTHSHTVFCLSESVALSQTGPKTLYSIRATLRLQISASLWPKLRHVNNIIFTPDSDSIQTTFTPQQLSVNDTNGDPTFVELPGMFSYWDTAKKYWEGKEFHLIITGKPIITDGGVTLSISDGYLQHHCNIAPEKAPRASQLMPGQIIQVRNNPPVTYKVSKNTKKGSYPEWNLRIDEWTAFGSLRDPINPLPYTAPVPASKKRSLDQANDHVTDDTGERKEDTVSEADAKRRKTQNPVNNVSNATPITPSGPSTTAGVTDQPNMESKSNSDEDITSNGSNNEAKAQEQVDDDGDEAMNQESTATTSTATTSAQAMQAQSSNTGTVTLFTERGPVQVQPFGQYVHQTGISSQLMEQSGHSNSADRHGQSDVNVHQSNAQQAHQQQRQRQAVQQQNNLPHPPQQPMAPGPNVNNNDANDHSDRIRALLQQYPAGRPGPMPAYATMLGRYSFGSPIIPPPNQELRRMGLEPVNDVTRLIWDAAEHHTVDEADQPNGLAVWQVDKLLRHLQQVRTFDAELALQTTLDLVKLSSGDFTGHSETAICNVERNDPKYFRLFLNDELHTMANSRWIPLIHRPEDTLAAYRNPFITGLLKNASKMFSAPMSAAHQFYYLTDRANTNHSNGLKVHGHSNYVMGHSQPVVIFILPNATAYFNVSDPGNCWYANLPDLIDASTPNELRNKTKDLMYMSGPMGMIIAMDRNMLLRKEYSPRLARMPSLQTGKVVTYLGQALSFAEQQHKAAEQRRIRMSRPITSFVDGVYVQRSRNIGGRPNPPNNQNRANTRPGRGQAPVFRPPRPAPNDRADQSDTVAALQRALAAASGDTGMKPSFHPPKRSTTHPYFHPRTQQRLTRVSRYRTPNKCESNHESKCNNCTTISFYFALTTAMLQDTDTDYCQMTFAYDYLNRPNYHHFLFIHGYNDLIPAHPIQTARKQDQRTFGILNFFNHFCHLTRCTITLRGDPHDLLRKLIGCKRRQLYRQFRTAQIINKNYHDTIHVSAHQRSIRPLQKQLRKWCKAKNINLTVTPMRTLPPIPTMAKNKQYFAQAHKKMALRLLELYEFLHKQLKHCLHLYKITLRTSTDRKKYYLTITSPNRAGPLQQLETAVALWHAKQTKIYIHESNMETHEQATRNDALQALDSIALDCLRRACQSNPAVFKTAKQFLHRMSRRSKKTNINNDIRDKLIYKYPFLQYYALQANPRPPEVICSGKLKILFLNIDGQIRSKLTPDNPYLVRLTTYHKPHLLALIDTRKAHPAHIPGYKLQLRKSPPGLAQNQHAIGGMHIYVKCGSNLKITPIKKNRNHDICWFTCTSDEQQSKHAFALIYCRPHNQKNANRCTQFWTQLTKDTLTYQRQYKHLTLMGDWNARRKSLTSDHHDNQNGKALEKFLTTFSQLIIANNFGRAKGILTYIQRNKDNPFDESKGSLIDLALTNDPSITDTEVDCDLTFEAHRPVILSTNKKVTTTKAQPQYLLRNPPKGEYPSANHNNGTDEIMPKSIMTDQSLGQQNNNLRRNLRIYTSALQALREMLTKGYDSQRISDVGSILHQYILHRHIILTYGLRKAYDRDMTHKTDAESININTKLDILRRAPGKHRVQIHNLMQSFQEHQQRTLEQRYKQHCEQLSQLSASDRSAQYKKHTHTRTHLPSTLLIDGSHKDAYHALQQQFKKVYESTPPRDNPHDEEIELYEQQLAATEKNQSSVQMNHAIIKDALLNMNKHGTPGITQITVRHLLHLPYTDSIITGLFLLFKLWDHTKYIPINEKAGIIACLPKQPNPTEPSHFRPITLLSVIFKLFEKVLLRTMQTTSDISSKIHPLQGGFRKQRGCLEQITTLITLSEHYQARKKPLFVAMLDIAKAFDTMWRKGLIWKLKEQFHISDHLCLMIQGMFQGTSAGLKRSNLSTLLFTTTTGVMQGSILGPILYSLFINDLIVELDNSALGAQIAENHLPAVVYCDDITLVAPSTTNLQHMIKIVEQHSYKWGYRFSPHKCKILPYNHPNPVPSQHTYESQKRHITQYCKALKTYWNIRAAPQLRQYLLKLTTDESNPEQHFFHHIQWNNIKTVLCKRRNVQWDDIKHELLPPQRIISIHDTQVIGQTFHGHTKAWHLHFIPKYAQQLLQTVPAKQPFDVDLSTKPSDTVEQLQAIQLYGKPITMTLHHKCLGVILADNGNTNRPIVHQEMTSTLYLKKLYSIQAAMHKTNQAFRASAFTHKVNIFKQHYAPLTEVYNQADLNCVIDERVKNAYISSVKQVIGPFIDKSTYDNKRSAWTIISGVLDPEDRTRIAKAKYWAKLCQNQTSCYLHNWAAAPRPEWQSLMRLKINCMRTCTEDPTIPYAKPHLLYEKVHKQSQQTVLNEHYNSLSRHHPLKILQYNPKQPRPLRNLDYTISGAKHLKELWDTYIAPCSHHDEICDHCKQHVKGPMWLHVLHECETLQHLRNSIWIQCLLELTALDNQYGCTHNLLYLENAIKTIRKYKTHRRNWRALLLGANHWNQKTRRFVLANIPLHPRDPKLRAMHTIIRYASEWLHMALQISQDPKNSKGLWSKHVSSDNARRLWAIRRSRAHAPYNCHIPDNPAFLDYCRRFLTEDDALAFTDGSETTNGTGGGLLFLHNGTRIIYRQQCGKQTNNYAELLMTLRALQIRKEHTPHKRLFIVTDSEYTYQALRTAKPFSPTKTKDDQYNGDDNPDDVNLPIKKTAIELFYEKDTYLLKVPSHLDKQGKQPIKGNEIADKLARKAAADSANSLQQDPNLTMLHLPLEEFASCLSRRNRKFTLATFLQTHIRSGRNDGRRNDDQDADII